MADNGKIIWDSLIKNGFTEKATAGIMGNLQAESGLDPKRVQGAGYITADNITVDGETGYGLAQWTFITRQEALDNFAKGKGRPSGDLMIQIDYLIMEIDQYGIKNTLNQQETAFAAAIRFHRDFEKSADGEGTPMENRRGEYAEAIYQKKGVGCSELAYTGDNSTYQFGTSSLPGTRGGQPSPANTSPKSETTGHGDHADTIFTNPQKLYCEPIYPDLVSINNKIPSVATQDVIKNCKTDELVAGSNLVYSLPVNTMTKYGGSDFVEAQALSTQIENQRKMAFDIKKHSKAYKLPSAGKPPNNLDPFPFDAKIEEFELHSPRCKIESIQTCPQAVNVARACMQLSSNVEKRLVHLENNLATMMRYIGRLSSRVAINCVYYGGQAGSDFEKYKCIRCLQDNRIDDGQVMTIDQCLTCTRYEPLIGQVYDILNDEGINLSQVLDDCQMSYTTMEEYCKFIKPTEHQKILTTKPLEKDSTNSRDPNDKDFSTLWSPGLKMDWTLFPVEDQRPHINKTQNINGDQMSQLESYQGSATNFGSQYFATGVGDRMTINKNMMDTAIASAKKGDK